MALAKRVKRGGSYYEGYELDVSSSPGSYVLDITQDRNCNINSVAVTPDAYGAGDSFNLAHMTVGAGETVALLGKSIYNQGASVSSLFDFPALEEMTTNEVLRLTYTNVAGETIKVHVIVEYVGILKTE